MAANLALYLGLCVGLPGVPAVAGWCWRRWVELRRRRMVRIRPAAGPPLEIIAADLHRIARCAETLPPGCAYARRRGTELAYDDVLVVACRALEIPTGLAGLPVGWERDVERLRVEACLGNAGLNVRA